MTSHITQQNDTIADLKERVCLSLRINGDTYDELFHESGCRFLELRYTPSYARALRAHHLFWKWWKAEYMLVDKQYLRETKHKISNCTQRFYLDLHVNMCYLPGKIITSKIMNQKAIK
jgi:hypothetical protein